MTFSKTTVSGIIGGAATLLAFIAAVPTALQAQLMSLVPPPVQGYLALIFAFAAFAAKAYQSKHTADAPPGPKEGDQPK